MIQKELSVKPSPVREVENLKNMNIKQVHRFNSDINNMMSC